MSNRGGSFLTEYGYRWEIVREHYSHVEAGELAELATAAFEEIDETDWSPEPAGESVTDSETAADMD